MTSENKNKTNRRKVLTGIGMAAAGVAATAAGAQDGKAGFHPARHAQDAWLDALPGEHRVLIDTSFATGGAESLLYANNILNAHTSAYGGKESEYAIVICMRHYATPFAYGDDVWSRYGESFEKIMQVKDPATGKAYAASPVNLPGRPDLPNMGNTVDAMVARGVHFAVCDQATRVISGVVANMVDGSAADIYDEFVASAVPNSHFVSAGVMATTRAQEYGYSLLYAG